MKQAAGYIPETELFIVMNVNLKSNISLEVLERKCYMHFWFLPCMLQ
jgi:hypothetical protein